MDVLSIILWNGAAAVAAVFIVGQVINRLTA